MRPDVMAELRAIMRGERVGMGGTAGTPGTLTLVPAQKCPSFRVFRVFRPEHDTAGNGHFEPGTSPGTCTLPLNITVMER
jgi:hypothetical protein